MGKVNPNDYQIPLPLGMTIEKIKDIAEKHLQIFTLPIIKSEIWKNGVLVIKAEGILDENKRKYDFFAKIENNEIKFKLNSNFEIKKITDLLEPRDSPRNDSDCAIYLEFWDKLLQEFGTPGRTDIGKPRTNAISSIGSTPIATSQIQSPSITSDIPSMPSNVPQSNIMQIMKATKDFKPSKAPSSMPNQNQIDLSNIPDEINPFLIDTYEKNPRFWKTPKSYTVTVSSILQAFQVALSLDGFTSQSSPKVPPSLQVYRTKGQFGPEKATIDIIAGEKDKQIYIRFAGDIDVSHIYDKDIRLASPQRSQSAYFVKIFDAICRDLQLPPREDFGSNKEDVSTDPIVIRRLNLIKVQVIEPLFDKLQKNTWIRSHITQFDQNSAQNFEDFKFIRKALEENIRWPMKNLGTFKLVLKNYFSPIVIIYLDQLDIKSKTIFPLMLSYAVVAPEFIAREISCSYKAVWTTSDNDEVCQKMVSRMNSESPTLENQMKDILRDMSTFFFQEDEIVDDRGKKIKLAVEQTLHSPFVVRNFEDLQGNLASALYISQYLKPESKGYNNLRDPNLYLNAFELAIDGLSRFYVKKESVQLKSEEVQLKGFNKCPKCGWTLSGNRTKCPMCGYDAALAGKASKETEFSASAALKNAKENARTDKLINTLDSMLNDIDDDTRKAQQTVLEIFNKVQKADSLGQALIKNTEEDTTSITRDYGALLRSLNQDIIYDIRPYHLFLEYIQELAFDRIVISLSMIKENYSNYYVPLVSYFIPVPTLPGKISLKIERPKEEEGVVKPPRFVWNNTGDDLGICEKFKNPEFMGFITDVFGGAEQAYASHFQLKKRDVIGRLQNVEGMLYELPFLISVRPFIEGGIPNHDVLVMHHFLKSEAEEFAGTIPFSKTLVLLDAIVAGIKSALHKAQQVNEPVAEVQNPQVFENEVPQHSELGQLTEEMDSVFGSSSESNFTQESLMGTAPTAESSPLSAPADQKQQIIMRCLDLGLNPNMGVADIDQKLQEIKFQRESINEMGNQLVQALSMNQIDQQGFEARRQEMNEYYQNFAAQEEALQMLRTIRS